MSEEFPRLLFITNLPETYTFGELTEFLETFGNLLEIEKMQDGHIRAVFENSKGAKKCFMAAKNKKLEFKESSLQTFVKKK